MMIIYDCKIILKIFGGEEQEELVLVSVALPHDIV
jgi:hypothetical protein